MANYIFSSTENGVLVEIDADNSCVISGDVSVQEINGEINFIGENLPDAILAILPISISSIGGIDGEPVAETIDLGTIPTTDTKIIIMI